MFATPAYAAAGSAYDHYVFSIFGFGVSGYIMTMWAVMAVIGLASYFCTRNLKKVPETRLQAFMEFVLESLLNFLAGVMGKEKYARKYFPVLGTFFILILASNYSGLIPGLKTPTSTISVTVAFALCAFFATHIMGVKAKGLSYFKHFIEPYPFLLPLNILEEFVKPLSLSLRLYGNIFGEKMVVAGLFSVMPLFLPIPMMLLALLFGFIQAVVFTLLAALYISTATADHH